MVHRRRSVAGSAVVWLVVVVLCASAAGSESVPGDPTQINEVPTWGGFEVSPDGSKVLYHVDSDERPRNVKLEPYSVSTYGGPNVRLSPEESGLATFTGDSSMVVYETWSELGGVELFAVPPGGGPSIDLSISQPLNVQESDLRWEVTPDSSGVVYWTDADTADLRELFSVPITGGPSVKLNGPVTGRGLVEVAVSPDSSRVIDRANGTDGCNQFSLFSVPIAGGVPTELATCTEVISISADSSNVVYTQELRTRGLTELFSVPISGGPPVKLGDVGTFVISPDSSKVVFAADGGIDGKRDLYVVAIGGGDVVELNAGLDTDGDVGSFRVSPDSAWVVYLADTDPAPWTGWELFQLPISGGQTPVKLTNGHSQL
jgi:hypothetical protein